MGFMDKLKSQASQLGGQIDDAFKGSKFGSELKSLQNQYGESISQLGNAVYSQYRQGGMSALNESQLKPYFDNLLNIEQQIAFTQQKIEEERQMKAMQQQQQQQQMSAPAPGGPPQQPPAPPLPPNAVYSPPPPQMAQPASPATPDSPSQTAPSEAAPASGFPSETQGPAEDVPSAPAQEAHSEAAPVTETSASPADTKTGKFCSSCGKPAPQNAAFCPNCGTAVNA